MVILHIYKFKDYIDHNSKSQAVIRPKKKVTSGHSAYPQEDWSLFVFKIMQNFLLLMLLYDWLIHIPTIGRHAYNYLQL